MFYKIFYLKFALVFLIVLMSGCKEPLEKKYNPQTFSEDIKELQKADQVIIKNVINAYEKNKQVNSIAGNETVLIPSLTFKEIKLNYIQYHKIWEQEKVSSIKETIKTNWAKKFTLPLLGSFLNKNLEITLDAQRVRDPKNNYYSRRVIVKNNYDKKINSSAILVTSKNLRNSKVVLRPPSLDSGESYTKIINDIDFAGNIPTSNESLNITDIKSIVTFAIGNTEYFKKDLKFVLDFAGDTLRNNINTKLSKVDSLVTKTFELTDWPYNNANTESLERKILNNKTFNLTLD